MLSVNEANSTVNKVVRMASDYIEPAEVSSFVCDVDNDVLYKYFRCLTIMSFTRIKYENLAPVFLFSVQPTNSPGSQGSRHNSSQYPAAHCPCGVHKPK